MSLINYLGGVDASRMEALDAKVNELSDQVGMLAEQISNIRERLNNMTELFTILNDHIAILKSMSKTQDEHQQSIDILWDNLTNNNQAISDMKVDLDLLTKSVNKLDIVPKAWFERVDKIDRCQNYFDNNLKKALNDISDLKKELYNLYGRQCPPPKEETDKSTAKTDDEITVMSILKEILNADHHDLIAVNRMLHHNNIIYLSDLKQYSMEELSSMKYCGPKVVELLQLARLYDDGSEVDINRFKPVAINDLHKLIFDTSSKSTKVKARVYKALKDRGINTVEDLQKTPYNTVLMHTRGIGKNGRDLLQHIYNAYIFA